MLNELLLLSGNDVPFYQAQITIHVPKLKEIALIGEESFYTGCELLTFSKDILSEEDRNNLIHQSNFDVLMSMMTDNNIALRKSKIDVLMLLSLLFPEYQIELTLKAIVLKKEDEVHSINNENFENFKEIITDIFCLKGNSDDEVSTYNPKGDLANKIAEKFKERQRKLAAQRGATKVAVLSRYASILAVGQRKDLNQIMQYTVYQLFDEIKRFELKEEFDFYTRAKLAGARDLKDVEHWKKDIHP